MSCICAEDSEGGSEEVSETEAEDEELTCEALGEGEPSRMEELTGNAAVADPDMTGGEVGIRDAEAGGLAEAG